MVKLARIASILLVIAVAASTLPAIYSRATSVKSKTPVVFYSPIKKMCVMQRNADSGLERIDEDGTPMNYREYSKALPFMFHSNLMKWGEYPDEISGRHISPEEVKREMQFIRITPRDINTPAPALGILFESQPEGASLAYPSDMFRLSPAIEFIECKTNLVDHDKSTRFAKALKNEGFVYPAQTFGVNPTTQKPFDWGCFIIDATGHLFHLTMKKGQPAVTNTGQQFETRVRKILVMEHERDEIYGVAVTDKNVFAIMREDYKLMPLPLENYSPDTDSVVLMATPLNHVIQQRGEQSLIVKALDDNWQPEHMFTLQTSDEVRERRAKLAALLFPFKLETKSTMTRFVPLRITELFEKPTWNLGGCLLALILYIPLHRRRFKKNPAILDIGVVALTGFYGLIAMAFMGPASHPEDSSPR